MLKIGSKEWSSFQPNDKVAACHNADGFLEVYRADQGRFLVLGKGKLGGKTPSGYEGDLLPSLQKCVQTHGLPATWVNQVLETICLGVQAAKGTIEGERYLVWSMQHHAWWKPDGDGYTKDSHKAGVFKLGNLGGLRLNGVVYGEQTPEGADVLVPFEG